MKVEVAVLGWKGVHVTVRVGVSVDVLVKVGIRVVVPVTINGVRLKVGVGGVVVIVMAAVGVTSPG